MAFVRRDRHPNAPRALPTSGGAESFRLGVCELESRVVPAVTVRFDYSLDTSGFFNDPAKRAALEAAVAPIEAVATENLAPIVPSGGNTWAATFVNPGTNQPVTLPNLAVNANELVIFISGADLHSDELGLTNSGGFNAAGTPDWLDAVRGRGQLGATDGTKSDIAPWGAMIAFDDKANWNFTAAPPRADQFDFHTVATHELLHAFGFGLGDPAFTHNISGTDFAGPHVLAVTGGTPAAVTADLEHFIPGTAVLGQDEVMQPSLYPGTRRNLSALDVAALQDMGWGRSGTAQVAPPPAAAQVAIPAPIPTPLVAAPTAPVAVVPPILSVAGANNVVELGAGGAVARSAQPFGPGYNSGLRVATADVTGDGVADLIAGTGPGVRSEVRVIDAVTGAQASIFPFESSYTGGVNVAAGDFTGDGRADIVITPDQAGGPVVAVYDASGLNGGQIVQKARFWGIDDPNFRGGLRPAVGDLNGDGVKDLAVSAGFGGGPRVAVYDGRTVLGGAPSHLAPDFFAFEQTLRNGAYISITDLNADGRGELVAGAGPGGGPRVTVFDGAAMMRGQIVPAADFFAGDPAARSGVRVASADLDQDGRPELIAATATQVVNYAPAQLFSGSPSPSAALPLPGAASFDGIYVG